MLPRARRGAQPDGQMQPEYVTTLEMMGDWLRMAGEAIYGTRAGPVPVSPWGVTTQRPGPWPAEPPSPACIT